MVSVGVADLTLLGRPVTTQTRLGHSTMRVAPKEKQAIEDSVSAVHSRLNTKVCGVALFVFQAFDVCCIRICMYLMIHSPLKYPNAGIVDHRQVRHVKMLDPHSID